MSELTPVELETALDRVLRGDQGAAQRIIDHNKVLRAKLKAVEQSKATWICQAHQSEFDRLEQQLATVTQERDAFIKGGVTEELLRAHDGYIKVGRGCVLVREDDWQQLAAVTHERNEVLTLLHRLAVTEEDVAWVEHKLARVKEGIKP